MVGAQTYRLGGLERSRGERVSTAAALGAQVRRGRGRVVDVRHHFMVPPLLLRAVRVVAVGRRSPRELAF